MNQSRDDDRSLGELLSRAVDSFGDLVALHIALTRAELARDAGRVAGDLIPLGAGALLVFVGYLLLCVAAGLGVGAYVGPVSGFALVGGLNLLVGGLALRRAVVALERPMELELSVGAEVRKTAQELLRHGDTGGRLEAAMSDAS
jgi:hypothetical protein